MNSSEEYEGRKHDVKTPDALAQFMAQGWAPSPLEGVTPIATLNFFLARRAKLSSQYAGIRLIIPSGGLKVRSNDTDFRFRPHTAFVWLTGITASDVAPDSVLILEPEGDGHKAILFLRPRDARDQGEGFYRDARYGEFWVGRRLTLDESTKRYGIEARHIESLEDFLSNPREAFALRGLNDLVDAKVEKRKKKDAEFVSVLSAMRLIKDGYEISEMQKAIDATARGFADMVRVFPAATSTKRGERVIESAFFGRARLEGNDLGYETIAASGSHACVLHWIRNDGDVKPGELILIDAGIEVDSFYTADITRTLPVNGTFSPAQRKLYMLLFDAQRAAMAMVKPGVKFRDINSAAQAVLAKGFEEMGVLPISAEESMKPENGLHRRWSLHGTSHMLGMDVHDCAQARDDQYMDGVLAAGMILTVEPGLYIQPDDELFPPEFRGIGIRIEDDVLVTETGHRNLSVGLPAHPDEIEVWMANLLR
jgi:Xaa-Pro aminopeptidase